jgi:hypothetical protein
MTADNHSIRNTFWFFGIVVGVAVSTVVTLIVVTWEWLENPGGIFRNGDGTNWNFILETAISWFVPTLIYTAIIASVLKLAWTALARYRNKG